MRPLELLTLLALAAVLVVVVAPRRRSRWLALAPAVAVGVTALQLIVEGYRWSMMPAYALALAFAPFAVEGARQAFSPPEDRAASSPGGAGSRRSSERRGLRVAGALLGVLLVVLSAVLSNLFPVFALPTPSGPFAIGSTALDLVDSTRPETLSGSAGEHREVLVRIWYPASPAGGGATMSLWGPMHDTPGRVAKALGFPAFLFGQLRHVKTHTVENAAVAPGGARLPLVVFSHGYAVGFESQNTVQMEELASHGYVVASIGHPYEAGEVAFPDGRVVPASKAQLDKGNAQAKAAGPLAMRYLTASDAAQQDSLLRRFIAAVSVIDTSLRVWTADTRFVLDELGRLDSGSVVGLHLRPADTVVQQALAGRLDLARVGLYGMSFGGTTAGQVCVVDPRCTAGLNLDGLQTGDMLDHPVERPFMFAASTQNARINAPLYRAAKGPVYQIVVVGTNHLDYTDLTLISTFFKRTHMLGPIEAGRMERIVSAYTLAFFDKYLRGQPSSLLNGPSPAYPEVLFAARNAPGAVTGTPPR